MCKSDHSAWATESLITDSEIGSCTVGYSLPPCHILQASSQGEPLARTPIFNRCMVALDVMAMVAFVAASAVILPDLARATKDHGMHALWLVPVVPLAHICADVFTGFMHFFADNFGSDRTPILGPAFIRRFREHHFDQKAICKLSFRELNGSLMLVASPLFISVALWVNESASLLAMAVSLFSWIFVLFGATTNQVHRWAHDDHPPRMVVWLAQRGLILNASHHAKHHSEPHDTHFCITHGWLNPLFDHLGIWHGVARGIAALGVPQYKLSAMGNQQTLAATTATSDIAQALKN